VNVGVIGSGFAGLAATKALVARGVVPTILDVGETLDPERQSLVEKLREIPIDLWSKEDYDRISRNSTLKSKELPKKMHFGSDYIYAAHRTFAPIAPKVSGRVPFPTFAKGGFSNIWGGAVLPVSESDMTDWPFSASELEPYFRKVAQFLPISGGAGTLEAPFPSYKDRLGHLDIGPQGNLLLKDLENVQDKLIEREMYFGKARLSVYTPETQDQGTPCVGCGECFVGCVHGSIFSTVPLFDELIRENCVAYARNLYVRSLREEDGKVCVETVNTTTGSLKEWIFDAVFVAAGPIDSTRILLRSGHIFGTTVSLKESQKFVIPMVRKQGAHTAIEDRSITLASVFLEFKVPELSDHWIHLQVVPMNRMVFEGAQLPGANLPIGEILWNPLLRRTMVGWCGLHSDHSSKIDLTLRQKPDSDIDVLEMDMRISERARKAVHKVSRSLLRTGTIFDTLFLPWLVRFSNPGSGTHCGSSFPMKRDRTGRFDTDSLGRPYNWSRVFVVDSSVLPSIPGTTLAYSVMANAYRIGDQAPLAS
jgi:choline dehydrogenase-like flavoprotein